MSLLTILMLPRVTWKWWLSLELLTCPKARFGRPENGTRLPGAFSVLHHARSADRLARPSASGVKRSKSSLWVLVYIVRYEVNGLNFVGKASTSQGADDRSVSWLSSWLKGTLALCLRRRLYPITAKNVDPGDSPNSWLSMRGLRQDMSDTAVPVFTKMACFRSHQIHYIRDCWVHE